ncbi:MAG: MarC family protein [Spirochaetales bacterium]|jgi:multiple antibiotic resistance protein|nr:MarC family protein [Spirochaetales bacterium]
MHLTFTLKEALLFQTALLAMFSPLGVIGPFESIAAGCSREIKRKMAFRVGLYTTCFLLIIAWSGDILLRILGISVAALGAAGGLILMLSSLPMVVTGEVARKKGAPEMSPPEGDEKAQDGTEGQDWERSIVSPLVFPITMGAGTISLMITQTGIAITFLDKLLVSCSAFIHGIVIFVTYTSAEYITRRLGNSGSATVTRIGGIILLCLAFSLFTNGIKVLLPGLG